MARTKQTARTTVDRRTTWTRFHLPREQKWPTWSAAHLDPHRGPLVGVEGIRNVWLGRKVEEPEKAALIVLWKTEDALKKFQDSPACEEFLQCLPQNGVEASLESGIMLGDLSLDDTGGSSGGSSSSPVPSRFLSLKWVTGSGFEEYLQGRVTFTALVVPYTSDSIPESSRNAMHVAMRNAFCQFRPRGCEDIHSLLTLTHALSIGDPWQLGEQLATAGDGGGRSVLCEFRQWNGYAGATLEREEAAANSPLTKESWAQKLAEVMPPVTAWAQERWDIQLAPREEEVSKYEYEENSDFDQNMEE
ncbi:hypothetical protein VE03_04214 [Pseudogymnoascus sp. 23342-1-I1]|nr:hypothetical protein VE03_04214 [Pseudogymnoascus sp. 23342-1-I1]